MPYVAVPTVNVGDLLTAANWNNMANDLSYFNGILSGSPANQLNNNALSTNVVFPGQYTITAGNSATYSALFGSRSKLFSDTSNNLYIAQNCNYSGTAWTSINTATPAYAIMLSDNNDNVKLLRKAATSASWTVWDQTTTLMDSTGKASIANGLTVTSGNLTLGSSTASLAFNGGSSSTISQDASNNVVIACTNNFKPNGSTFNPGFISYNFQDPTFANTLFSIASSSGKLGGKSFYDSAETSVATGATVTFAHGLGAIPRYYSASWNTTTGNSTQPVCPSNKNTVADVYIRAVDATNVYISNATASTAYVTVHCML